MPLIQDLGNKALRLGAATRFQQLTYDIDQTAPALRRFEQHTDEICEELLGILPDRALTPKYHEVDQGRSHISSEDDGESSWRVYMLYAMGAKPDENRVRCPLTCKLLDETPNLFQAFFSILEPHKSVPAHCGPYAGYLRYHLPLIVPTENPPKMRIKDLWHTWRVGEPLLFDDHWEHEVVNHSDEVRVVLIVDIFRPLPPIRDLINRLVTHSYLRRSYGLKIARGQQPDL